MQFAALAEADLA